MSPTVQGQSAIAKRFAVLGEVTRCTDQSGMLGPMIVRSTECGSGRWGEEEKDGTKELV